MVLVCSGAFLGIHEQQMHNVHKKLQKAAFVNFVSYATIIFNDGWKWQEGKISEQYAKILVLQQAYMESHSYYLQNL